MSTPAEVEPDVDRNGHELVTRTYTVSLHGLPDGLPDEMLHDYAAAAVREELGLTGRAAIGPVTVKVAVSTAVKRRGERRTTPVEVSFRVAYVGDKEPADIVAAREAALQRPVTILRRTA